MKLLLIPIYDLIVTTITAQKFKALFRKVLLLLCERFLFTLQRNSWQPFFKSETKHFELCYMVFERFF